MGEGLDFSNVGLFASITSLMLGDPGTGVPGVVGRDMCSMISCSSLSFAVCTLFLVYSPSPSASETDVPKRFVQVESLARSVAIDGASVAVSVIALNDGMSSL